MARLTPPALLATAKARSRFTPSLVEVLDECYQDIGLLAKTFFPQRFRAPYTKLHYELIDGINETLRRQQWLKARGKKPFVKFVVKGPRGVAKTQFLQFAVPTWMMLFQESRFIAIGTKTLGNTLTNTEDLRRELVTSEQLKPVIGNIKGGDGEFNDTFGKEAWIANIHGHRCLLLPRGIEGRQVYRGLTFDGYRLGCGIFDDYETVEMLYNDELRKKSREYFWSDPYEAFNQFGADTAQDSYLFFGDNCKHEDSMVEHLFQQTGDDWIKVHLSVCDENYKSLDESFITTAQITEELIKARANGTLDIWTREKMAKPGAPENAPFKREFFRYYDEEVQWETYPKDHDLQTWLIIDLATTITTNSDYSALVILTIDYTEPTIFLRDILIERLTEEEIVMEAVRAAIRFRINALGIETTGQAAFAGSLFKQILTIPKLVNVSPVELSAVAGRGELKGEGAGKIARIKSMNPYFRWGIVYFNRAARSLVRLEDQLVNFPKAAKKDGPDAMAYFQQMAVKLGEEFVNPIEALQRAADGVKTNASVRVVTEGGVTQLVTMERDALDPNEDIYRMARRCHPPALQLPNHSYAELY